MKNTKNKKELTVRVINPLTDDQAINILKKLEERIKKIYEIKKA